MLDQQAVRRFAHESGVRDLQVVEKEIVLTHFLQMLSERGFLRQLAFKGGTCIRKTWLGTDGRFSTDIDFTSLVVQRQAEELILELADISAEPYEGIRFEVELGDGGWYEAGDAVSWAAEPRYVHDWARGTIKLQVSNREVPTLAVEERAQRDQSYFRRLAFVPAALQCLAIEEILAEKIRATYQREKPRDVWDLHQFAARPLPQALIRKLVVLKIWQSRDTFVPDRWFEKLADAGAWDWHDLRTLVRGGVPDPAVMLRRCRERFAFLGELEGDEAMLAADGFQRLGNLRDALSERCRELAQGQRLV